MLGILPISNVMQYSNIPLESTASVMYDSNIFTLKFYFSKLLHKFHEGVSVGGVTPYEQLGSFSREYFINIPNIS